MLIWVFRVLLVVTCILGMVMSAGCQTPQLRVKCVHLYRNRAATADVCLRWRTREVCAAVAVERVVEEREGGDGEEGIDD